MARRSTRDPLDGVRIALVKPIFLLLIALALLAAPGSSADGPNDLDAWVPVGFVILRSTSDYAEARRVAEEAAKVLEVPLNYRGLQFDEKLGLSFSAEVCQQEASAPHPCYLARGRYDSGEYLSIERSDAYESFQPGYFIVIFATGAPGSAELASSLAKARKRYADAYLKSEKVYHGCMH